MGGWRRGNGQLSQPASALAICSSEGALAESSRRLQGLLQVARVVNSSLELPVVLDRIVSCAREILGAESGSVMLLEPELGSLRVVAARGPREREILGRSQSLEEGVAGWVTQRGHPLLLRGRVTDPRVLQICERSDVRDALCAPLRVEEHVLGAISLSNRLLPEPFGEEDLEVLVALSNQAAVAIRNAESFEEMRRQRQTVERLLHELTGAQVEERKRIALQLHDGPAQTMYAALRNLETARLLTELPTEQAQAAFAELERSIRRSIEETRAVMLDLRPPVLDEWGLESALKQYAQDFERRTGIRTTVMRKGMGRRLPAPMECCFYRIAQEALTNVWKHAEAQSARVSLRIGRRDCSLEVADDGKGFEPEAVSGREREHLGLMSLRDRAQLVGGHLTVSCRPGRGTTVAVSAPLAD